MKQEAKKDFNSRYLVPVSHEAIFELNKTAEIYNKKIGPNTAKFVQQLILENIPEYQISSQRESDYFVYVNALHFRRVAENDPAGLLGQLYKKEGLLITDIQEAQVKGSAHGIGVQDDKNLEKLGKTMVFIHETIGEISKKFPRKFLDFVAARKKIN